MCKKSNKSKKSHKKLIYKKINNKDFTPSFNTRRKITFKKRCKIKGGASGRVWIHDNNNEKYRDLIEAYNKNKDDNSSIKVWGDKETAINAINANDNADERKRVIRIIFVRHGTGLHNEYSTASTNEKYNHHNNKELRAIKDIDNVKFQLACKITGVDQYINPYDKLTDPSLTEEGIRSVITDPSLTEEGIHSVIKKGKTLYGEYKDSVKLIYVSPLKRTIQTAYLLMNDAGDDVMTQINNDEKLYTFLNNEKIKINENCREQIGGNIYDKLMYNDKFKDIQEYNKLFDDNNKDAKFKSYSENKRNNFETDKWESNEDLVLRGKQFMKEIFKDVNTPLADDTLPVDDTTATIVVSTHSGFLYAILHGVFSPQIETENNGSISVEQDESKRKFFAWFQEGEGRDFYFLI